MAHYTLKQFKSIINVRKTPDNWFWEKYGINPYNGCEHGCIYCDSRSAKYYLPADFENDIIIKDNVKEMLNKRISNARGLLTDIVGMAGASDPYHTAEAQYKNTLQCLEVLEKYKFPVHILTKSKLVLRDLDIMEQIGKHTWSCISVTITTSDKDIATFLEPNAPGPDIRFDIIRKIKNATSHIQTGVLLMPVIPYLCDAPWQLEDLIKIAKDSGADYVVFGGGMTMRNIQALWFLKHLRQKFPLLISKYEQIYRFKYDPANYNGDYGASNQYNKKINNIIWELCKKHDMPVRIKRFIPDDYRKMNYIIAEKLLNLAYELQLMDDPDKNMHWAGINIQQLKVPVQDLFHRSELFKIKNMNSNIEEIIKSELKKENKNIQQTKQLNIFNP